MSTELQALPRLVAQLSAEQPAGGRALSVYLDTSPARIAGQAYLLSYRDGCKALRAELSGDDRERFNQAAAQAERYVTGIDPSMARPGLALFASGDGGFFHVIPLPAPPDDEVVWDDHPHIAPLQAMLDEHERVALLLFDSARARLFTVFLAMIEDEQVIEDDVPRRQATGDWYALAQTRYARHREQHILRHVRRTIEALQATLRARPFDRLVLAGPDEALALLRRELPRPLRALLAGTVAVPMFAGEVEVLQAAREAAAAAARQSELTAVTELVDAAATSHVELGRDATLAALSEGRVHRLFVADTLHGTCGECDACGRLTPDIGPCPACEAPVTHRIDLRERAVERALVQGATVKTVTGEAATRLAVYDGLGAWTRYRSEA